MRGSINGKFAAARRNNRPSEGPKQFNQSSLPPSKDAYMLERAVERRRLVMNNQLSVCLKTPAATEEGRGKGGRKQKLISRSDGRIGGGEGYPELQLSHAIFFFRK